MAVYYGSCNNYTIIVVISTTDYGCSNVRRDKLNSQFIVTKFSILHAGGRSLFRFQTSRETRMPMRSPEPRPLIRALEWVRPKDCIFTEI